VAGRPFRADVAGDERAVELAGRVGDGDVHDDARQPVVVEQLPERVGPDVGAVDQVPVVAVEREEVERAVFPRVDAGVQRRPRARGPRRDLRLQGADDAALEQLGERRQPIRVEKRIEHVPTGAVEPDQQRPHPTRLSVSHGRQYRWPGNCYGGSDRPLPRRHRGMN